MDQVFYRFETWPYSLYRFCVCCNQWKQTGTVNSDTSDFWNKVCFIYTLDNMVIEETMNTDCSIGNKDNTKIIESKLYWCIYIYIYT